MGCACSCSKKKSLAEASSLPDPKLLHNTPTESVDSVLVRPTQHSPPPDRKNSDTKRQLSLDLNQNVENPDHGDEQSNRESACQTTDPLPDNVFSDATPVSTKTLNGYYPNFSPIHTEFLKAKSLDAFLQENDIPLATAAEIKDEDLKAELEQLTQSGISPSKSVSSTVLEAISEDPENSCSTAVHSRSDDSDPTSAAPVNDHSFPLVDGGDGDESDTTLGSLETLNTAFYSISMSRASSYGTSLDVFSSEWNVSLDPEMDNAVFIADI